jgi:hypothetical protein
VLGNWSDIYLITSKNMPIEMVFESKLHWIIIALSEVILCCSHEPMKLRHIITVYVNCMVYNPDAFL